MKELLTAAVLAIALITVEKKTEQVRTSAKLLMVYRNHLPRTPATLSEEERALCSDLEICIAAVDRKYDPLSLLKILLSQKYLEKLTQEVLAEPDFRQACYRLCDLALHDPTAHSAILDELKKRIARKDYAVAVWHLLPADTDVLKQEVEEYQQNAWTFLHKHQADADFPVGIASRLPKISPMEAKRKALEKRQLLAQKNELQ